MSEHQVDDLIQTRCACQRMRAAWIINLIHTDTD